MSEQSDARLPLSVLVPVKNEAANLPGCIASVSFALRATPFGTAIERKRWLKESHGERAIPSQLAIPLSLSLQTRFS